MVMVSLTKEPQLHGSRPRRVVFPVQLCSGDGWGPGENRSRGGHLRAKQQTLTHKRGRHSRADQTACRKREVKPETDPGSDDEAAKTGSGSFRRRHAARELHASEVARRRSGAWRRVRQRKAARVAGLGRTSRGDLNPGLTGENRRRWRPAADGGNPL